MVASTPPHIVIIGAGFGGLQTAVSLGGLAARVTLIDRNNYHTFVPLLYQVATATLEPEWIALPIHKLLRRYKNVQFVQGNVEAVDLTTRRVQTEQVTLQYDYLVLDGESDSSAGSARSQRICVALQDFGGCDHTQASSFTVHRASRPNQRSR